MIEKILKVKWKWPPDVSIPINGINKLLDSDHENDNDKVEDEECGKTKGRVSRAVQVRLQYDFGRNIL